MIRKLIVVALLSFVSRSASLVQANEPRKTVDAIASSFDSNDWPWWRGPRRNGVAAADQAPPLDWSETKNVAWKSLVPGRGHGSPIVVGQKIFLLTAESDREVQSVLCYDRLSGKAVWQKDLHHGGFNLKGNEKSTFANSTVACDGERVFASFLHDGAVYATALDLDGNQLWQTKITDYVLHQGFGSSPGIYDRLVIVTADNKGTGAVAAMERTTGKIVWKHDRPKLPNYTSPIVLNVAGRDQLICTGCNLVSSFDPLSGEKIWEIKGATEECVASTVTDGELIYTSGGYPRNHLAAVRADGSGKIAWENGTRVYVPSMLLKDGYLYTVLDAGVAICWKCDTGKEIWKHRIDGTFTASPVLVGDKIFATNEAGRTYIFNASPDGFTKIAENDLAEQAFATPTICGSRIYIRAASMVDGNRQEALYCVAEK